VNKEAHDFQGVITREANIAQTSDHRVAEQESDSSSREPLETEIQAAGASLAAAVTNLGNLRTNQALTGPPATRWARRITTAASSSWWILLPAASIR
jgi:hypothetical protein